MKPKRILLAILICIHGYCVFSQLSITDANTAPYTPQNLISNVFLGSGVNINSISYTGTNSAIGYFSGGEDVFGIERGIVISTSEARVLNFNNTSLEDVNNGDITSDDSYNDADLLNLATNNGQNDYELFDISKYEITFVPTSDTLRFRYVFASEEYPIFVCNDFNDVFGFFISGPNPEGGNYISQNIALVPDPDDPSGLSFTNIPVAINNVHNAPDNCPPEFPEYYNSNPIGTEGFSINAYLDVFTAEAIVVPCQEYTIKLGVSDVTDNRYASAVFLEAKSFGTGSLTVNPNTASIDGSIAEGCANGELVFSLPNEVNEDYSIDFSVILGENSNDATPGIDYAAFPEELIIPAGEKSISIPLEAYQDNIDEGDEIILFEVQVDRCTRRQFEITIRDDILLAAVLPQDLTVCEGESLMIEPELDPGFDIPESPFFENIDQLELTMEGIPMFSDIEVSNVFPSRLEEGLIESVCITGLEHRSLNDLDIFLISPGGQFLELSTDNGFKPNNIADIDSFSNTCFTPDASIDISNGNNLLGPIITDNPKYTGDFLPEGNWRDLWDGSSVNGTWRLMIIDDEVGITGTLGGWSITFSTYYELNYLWSPNDGSIDCNTCQDINVTPENNTSYELELTDSYGCSAINNTEVTIIPGLTSPVASCADITQNSITVNWTDVPDHISFELRIDEGTWIDVGSDLNYTFEGLNFNTDYEINVIALGENCNSEIVSLTCTTLNCDPAIVTVENIIEPTCPGGTNGSIEFSANGMFPPYSFELNGFSNSTGLFQNLTAGMDTLYFLDSEGCPVFVPFTINEPDEFEFKTFFDVIDPCNFEGNLNAGLELMGGTAPYSFAWSEGSMDSILSNVSPGVFEVSITDQNNCTFNYELTIPEFEQFEFEITTSSPSCFSENDGSASFDLISGTGPFNFSWSTGDTTENIDNLAPGQYDLTATDMLGCVQVKSFEISEGPVLINNNTLIVDASCAGYTDGSIDANIAGGAGNYSYQWSNGIVGTSTISNLGAGIFDLTVSDENDCTAVFSFEVFEPEGIEYSINIQNNLCFGTEQGRINIELDTLEELSIRWDDGAEIFERVGLAIGDYCFTITDANGCETDSCIQISEPGPLVVDAKLFNPGCSEANDGRIELMVSGATMPYTFSWDGPGSLSNSATIENLLAGNYSVTITDANNCQSVYIYELLTSSPLNLDFQISDIQCFGDSTGSAEVILSGGTPPFNYLWNNGSTENTLENLKAGNYLITITDFNGCVAIDSVTIMEPESPVELEVNINDLSCFESGNGSLELIARGGSGVYQFSLDNESFGSFNFFPNLEAGTYSAFVQDLNGCIAAIDSIEIEQPDELIVDLGSDLIIDYGEIITINPEIFNGNGNLIYQWITDHRELLSCQDCPNPEFEGIQESGLELIVTDNNGCQGRDFFTIRIKNNAVFLVPTAFTPNGDGENDQLSAFGRGISSISKFEIFNRWGERVYTSNTMEINNKESGWDGLYKSEKAPAEVYFWFAEIVYENGFIELLNGNTSLIR